jgi:hypothetical protein
MRETTTKRCGWWLFLCFCVWGAGGSAWAQDVDFEENYRAGKEMISQKLYYDAVRLLYPAVFKTKRGSSHFGANFYLGMAYYNIGSVTQAIRVLKQARMLADKRSRREMLYMLLKDINARFGELQIVMESDTNRPKVLQLSLTPQKPFKDSIQKKAYEIIANLWKKKGISLETTALWLPKGEYHLEIPQPMCLSYAFTIGGAVITELTISENSTTLGLKDQASCKCTGGQIVKKEGQKSFCTCPDGMVWMDQRKRCITQAAADNRGWFAKNWPWVTAIGVAVVAAGVAIPVTMVVMRNQDREIEFGKTTLFLQRR